MFVQKVKNHLRSLSWQKTIWTVIGLSAIVGAVLSALPRYSQLLDNQDSVDKWERVETTIGTVRYYAEAAGGAGQVAHGRYATVVMLACCVVIAVMALRLRSKRFSWKHGGILMAGITVLGVMWVSRQAHLPVYPQLPALSYGVPHAA